MQNNYFNIKHKKMIGRTLPILEHISTEYTLYV